VLKYILSSNNSYFSSKYKLNKILKEFTGVVVSNSKPGDKIYRKDEIDDFRSETHDIIKDLNSIHTN